MMKRIQNKLAWDYSDIRDDIFYKSEVQANKIVAITMINCTVILLITFILNLTGVFNINSNSFNSIVWQGFVELLVPSILCFILKGRKKWLKYVLLLEFVVVCARIDSVLTYNVTLFMIIPTILSCRYYSSKFTGLIAGTTSALMLLSSLFWGKTQAAVDYNLFTIQEILDSIVNGEFVLPSDYTLSVIMFDFLPRFLLFTVIAFICVASAKKGKHMIEEQAIITEKSSRIESELSLATEIQASMLPSIFPPYPDKNEFDLYATMAPAKEVGGDFYDFFMLDDKTIALVIADVSGKGVGAALFMVIAKTLIKNQAQAGLNPGEVFTKVNQMLCENNEIGLFVTAWLGYLNTETGVLTYANAGHNPPLIKSEEGVYKYLKCKPGFVLAGMEAIKYRNFTYQMNASDRLFLYTDGVTEATNINKELYGEARLLETINKNINIAPKDVIATIKADLADFYGEAEQFDDITMLSFEFKKLYINNAIEREFKALDGELDVINEFIEEELSKKACNPKIIRQINIATEEVFVNIAHYAYSNNVGKMRLSIEYQDNYAIFKFEDYGMPFNPLSKKDPDITLSAEEREIGGLGIFMVKKMMDDVSYKYENGKNILYLKKKIME